MSLQFRAALVALLAVAVLLAPSSRSFADAIEPALVAAVGVGLDRVAGPGGAPLVTVVGAGDGWAFGTAARPAPARETTPLALLFLAQRRGTGWEAALEGEPGFAAMLRRAPQGVADAETRGVLDSPARAASGEAQLGLPFGVGETWYFTGGPHPGGFDSAEIWSALDFAGSSGIVRAAREGVAFVPCPNLVKVYHADGFQTGYYHLADVSVANGQPVARGTPLGRTSEEVGCGGQAFGSHVHFWLMRGASLPIAGTAVGGWTAGLGAAPYQGCLTRGWRVECAGSGRIFNDGTVGAGALPRPELRNGSFESGDGPEPWERNGPCAASAALDPAGSREGQRYLAASSPGPGCLSVLQDVPAAPSAGATYRLAVWVRSADATPRRATLALWALGPATSVATALVDLDDAWRCGEVALPIDGAGYTGLRAELYLGSDGAYHFDAATLAQSDWPLCPPAQTDPPGPERQFLPQLQ